MAMLALFGVTGLQAQNAATPAPAETQRKILIVVENRADAALNDKVSVLEDLVSSRVAGKGFSVVTRDVAVNALKSYSSAGVAVSSQSGAAVNSGLVSDRSAAGIAVNAGQRDAAIQGAAQSVDAHASQASASDVYHDTWKPSNSNKTKTYAEVQNEKYTESGVAVNTSAGAAEAHEQTSGTALHASAEHADEQNAGAVNVSRYDSAHIAVTPDTSPLDQALSDNSSVLRLAQNLGVDYILIPAITSYGTEKKSYSGNGIQTLNITHRLRVSYKIVEAGMGGAVRGGTFVSESTVRQTGDLQTDSSDILNSLLDDAADQLATAITASGSSLPTEMSKVGLVSFSVACTMTDPRQQPILVSALGVTADNKIVTGTPAPAQPMDVTVELDGVALGSAPGEFKAHPGLHKLRLSREGFDDWTRTINVYDGQSLRVALQMSDEGYAKWKDTTDFLATLDANRKLTDAEVKRVEGVAEYFKNSHYRVDAKNAPNVNIYKSLY